MDNKPVPKSTAWARANKDRVKERDAYRSRTLNGKLINLVTTSRYRAKQKGLDHSIDTEILKRKYEEQDGNCALTGLKMDIRGSKHASNSPKSISLDRIDSEKGYIEDNIWLVCTGVNLMKSRLSMKEFVDFCSLVSERFA
jgi:hypothetical protein